MIHYLFAVIVLLKTHSLSYLLLGFYQPHTLSTSGFIGWTSFTVIPSSAPEFYRKVEDLFGEGRYMSLPGTYLVTHLTLADAV